MRHQRTLALAVVLCGLPAAAAGQLGARSADEWIKMLDSPARIAGLKVDEVVKRLDLEAGDVVADLGAGTGVFSLPMARAVGPKGLVYAVDIEHGFMDHIARKAKEAGLTNVRPVLGKLDDPALPAGGADVAFMHDVLHHIQNREAYLENAARYLGPEGRFAIVEFDGAKGPHRDNPQMQLTKDQLAGWMAALGFEKTDEAQIDDTKWYVVYRRKG